MSTKSRQVSYPTSYFSPFNCCLGVDLQLEKGGTLACWVLFSKCLCTMCLFLYLNYYDFLFPSLPSFPPSSTHWAFIVNGFMRYKSGHLHHRHQLLLAQEAIKPVYITTTTNKKQTKTKNSKKKQKQKTIEKHKKHTHNNNNKTQLVSVVVFILLTLPNNNNNSNKCISNALNPSMTIHVWGPKRYTWNITTIHNLTV